MRVRGPAEDCRHGGPNRLCGGKKQMQKQTTQFLFENSKELQVFLELERAKEMRGVVKVRGRKAGAAGVEGT